jgi:two-component system response regulator RegX3
LSKILVVEDDRAISETVAYNLRREQHEVFVALDGAAGLKLAREEGPDLVVLDLMLPVMSGTDVCRILRMESPVLILILSARDTELDRVVGLELGADDYLTKPFSMRELVATVHALLRRDRISRDSATEVASVGGQRCGPIELDARAHEVRVRGEPVALKPKEFELLEYFVRHPAQVVSRQMILDSVWGYNYDGSTRTVDVHVRWLREKIEEDPSRPVHLTTIRHFGYKFVP